MVMSSTRSAGMKRALFLGLALATAAGLSGCLVSQIHQRRDFGVAVSQDVVAQITDPDRQYPATPPPSSGARATLAQGRYRTGTTIPPAATASDVGVAGSVAPPAATPGAGAAMPGS
jgi:hypothetical protein